MNKEKHPIEDWGQILKPALPFLGNLSFLELHDWFIAKLEKLYRKVVTSYFKGDNLIHRELTKLWDFVGYKFLKNIEDNAKSFSNVKAFEAEVCAWCKDYAMNWIIDEIKAQNKEVTSYLYNDLLKSSLKIIKKIIGKKNRHLAGDFFHETFFDFLDNINSGKFVYQPNSSFSTYFVAIAKNKWIAFTRKFENSRRTDMEGLREASSPTNNELIYILNERSHLLRDIIGRIGESCKRILFLFYYENHSIKEIASIVDSSADSIKARKYKCIKKLREKFGQELKETTNLY